MANMVKKASVFEILNHWITAVSFIILAVTGYGFLFHLEQLNSIFGNFNVMKDWHNWSGVVFTVSLFFTIFNYLPVSLSFGSDDIGWIFKAGGYFSKRAAVPPQDRLNAGQKLFYLLLLIAGIAISASGFVIWLMPGVRKWVLLSHLAHNISFDLLIIAVPLHIYLATLANPGTFRIMVYGTVPIEWAKKRHAKWVQKMGF
ncbi:MAG: cytochrome b/b6 domain-containing protein [Thermodesulfovibrionales bacterium]|nr:cytochrome b/b6 domain-containing protein [Thermodesulfovibrionales bacterium]